MGEHDRRREQDLAKRGDGGAAVSSGSSSSDLPPPSDAPTLAPEPSSGPDTPTLAPLPAGSPFDAPTLDGLSTPPPRRRSKVQSLVVSQAVLEEGAVLAQRYEIVRTLGEGGMGAVYQARDLELSRMVALKVIRPDLARNPAIIERFKQEILLSQRVTHKNVIRIYDLGEGDGVKFITMEFIEGQDLRSLIHKRTKLPPGEAVEIMEQICLALEAAHSVGVIHRDLKPQNVMREENGRILVMDFGLARTIEGSGMTQTGALVGTVEYMSPEQALAKDLDQRSDLFSAGLIFYELLTGQMPYRADSALASLIRRTQERAVPVLDYDSTIPAQLSHIVSKCLEREPSVRYQSAAELLADLQAWQGKRTAGAIAFQSVKPWGQTIPWPKIGGVAAVLILALSGYLLRDKLITTLPTKTVAGPSVSLAILPFRNASGDSSLDWLGSSVAEMLTTDVGQSARVRTISPDRLHQVLSDLRITPATTVDPATLARIAEFSSADTIVSGQFVRFGEQIRIDATVRDLKRNRSVPLKVEGVAEKDIPGAVDRLAESIRQNLAVSPDVMKELKAQSLRPSTSSVQALRYYNEGLSLARQGQNIEAEKRFQAAVKEDAGFALAYSRLAQIESKLGHESEAEQASRKAVDLSENLSGSEKYLIAANDASIKKDYKKAIESYENLVKVSPSDADVQFALAGLYENTGAFDKARALYSSILENDPKNLYALHGLGRAEEESGNLQTSLDPLQRAVNLAIEVDNKEERALILLEIGIVYKQLNKPQEALRNYQASLEINRQIGQSRGVAANLSEIAQIQTVLGKPDIALASLKEAHKIRQDIGATKEAGDTLIDLANFYNDRGDHEQALRMLKESLQIQREAGDETYQALCLNNIGDVYFSQGEYENALTYFQQALQVREKLKVAGDLAETLHNVGETFARMGQYEQALSTFLRTMDIRRSSGDSRGGALDSVSMGAVFERQGRYGAAVKATEEALQAMGALKDRSSQMVDVLAAHGNALAQAGRSEEADKVLDEALALGRELRTAGSIAQVFIIQADNSVYRGQLESARSLYNQALRTAAPTKERETVLAAKLGLAKLNVKSGPRRASTDLTSLARQAEGLGMRFESLQASVDAAEALINSKEYATAVPALQRAQAGGEKLRVHMVLAKAHYLQGVALRLTGKQREALGHYREALQLLEDIKKDSGNDRVMQREDLKGIYSEVARWAEATKN